MVNNDGGVLLDQYVRPAEKVTDYRTFVSGIEPAHLKEGAVSLAEAQMQVAQILTNRILVGHAVHHDLQVDLQINISLVKSERHAVMLGQVCRGCYTALLQHTWQLLPLCTDCAHFT